MSLRRLVSRSEIVIISCVDRISKCTSCAQLRWCCYGKPMRRYCVDIVPNAHHTCIVVSVLRDWSEACRACPVRLILNIHTRTNTHTCTHVGRWPNARTGDGVQMFVSAIERRNRSQARSWFSRSRALSTRVPKGPSRCGATHAVIHAPCGRLFCCAEYGSSLSYSIISCFLYQTLIMS